jgi:hypothetical protein
VVTVTGGANRRLARRAHRHQTGLPTPADLSRAPQPPTWQDKHKGFTETDFARLVDAAHQPLAGPLVVVWDNLKAHVSATMTELIAARGWPTIYQLPPYAHELNPGRVGVDSPEEISG